MAADLRANRYYAESRALRGMRSNILVICQSFLVVPFAILQTAAVYSIVAVYAYIVAGLGIFSTLILLRPLDATHRTINKWLAKQRKLFGEAEDLRDLALDRDMIPGADSDPKKDRDHRRSVAFSVYGPWGFFIFWCAAIAWSTVRVFVL